VIYSIGTSRRTKEEFLELLKEHGIEQLIDVRRFPHSRYQHFVKENLKKFLEENGIKYFYLGDKLGGYRQGGYRLFMETDDYKSGVCELENIAVRGRTVFMCAERFPWRCHRRFISQSLEERGWKVIHIIDKGRVWIKKKSEKG